MSGGLTPGEIRASKRLAHALRHDPGKYCLELDGRGFAPLGKVLDACGCDEAALRRILDDSDKPRFQVAQGKIRATHGHTVDVDAAEPPREPPSTLYHGTTEAALATIVREGLRPMRRQYVHLHEGRSVAADAAARFKGRGASVMLIVDAAGAHMAGVEFRPSQGGVWLAKHVPARFLQRDDMRE